MLFLSFGGSNVCVLADSVTSSCAHLCYCSRPLSLMSALLSGLQGSGAGGGVQVSRQRFFGKESTESSVPITFVVNVQTLSILFLSSVKWA